MASEHFSAVEVICGIALTFAAAREIPAVKYTRASTLDMSRRSRTDSDPDPKIRTRLAVLQLDLEAASFRSSMGT